MTPDEIKNQSATWQAGYDCGLNGPSISNCNYVYFSTKENMEDWEAGRKKGIQEKHRLFNEKNKKVATVRTCRKCGCHDNDACYLEGHGNCWWVEPDLCSHCANWAGQAKRYSQILSEPVK